MLFVVMLLASENANAQFQRRDVEGMVLDTAKQPVRGVSVRLSSVVDTLVTATDDEGRFLFRNVISREFSLNFSILGHQTLDRSYLVGANYEVVQILPIVIVPLATQLKEIEINRVQPMLVRGDTIQYNLEAYSFRKNTLLESVLKDLPGIHVMRDGTVIAHGKRISRVQVDGKNFFGGDVLIATRNLHAEMIKNVQVIDYYGDEAEATGFKNNEPEKILNLELQDDRKRIFFGQVTGGGGSAERYIGSFGIHNFNAGQQLSVIASANNTNTSLFSFGSPSGEGERQRDLMDLTGMTDPVDGINTVRSFGLNFSDSLTDHVEIYGKYTYTHRKNTTQSDQFLRSGFEFSTIENLETRETFSDQKTHSMTWDVNIAIDDHSYFKVSPQLAYTTNNSLSNSLKTLRSRYVFSEGEYGVDGQHDSPTVGTDMIYVKSFQDPRRKLVIDGRIEFTETDRSELIGDYFVSIDSSFMQPKIDIYSFLQKSDNRHNNRIGKLSGAYVEPLHPNGELELRYQYEYNSIGSSREIFDVEMVEMIDSLGIDYDYSYRSNWCGLTYKAVYDRKLYYSLGIAMQPLELEGATLGSELRTSYQHLNWIPTMKVSYHLSSSSMFSVDYTGSNNQPVFTQMQPVRDLSNSQHIIIGNPNLRAEFSNRVGARFFVAASNGFQTFEGQVSFNDIKNKIVANRRTIPGTTVMETTYLNADGYYDLRGYYSFNTRLGMDELYLGLSGSGDFIHNISFTNDLRNVSKHFIYSQNAQLRYSREEVIDIGLNGNFMMNTTRSSLRTLGGIQANSLLLGMAGRVYMNPNWTLGFDLSHRTHTGYSSFVESNPTLFNAYLEYTFLPNDRALLRFQGVDIFNQGAGVTKEVYDSMDLSVRNNRLGQYFMVSLNVRFQRLPASG